MNRFDLRYLSLYHSFVCALKSQPIDTFSTVAKQALPPSVICELLGFDKESVKAAFEAGKPPTATLDQLTNAMKQSVDPEVRAAKAARAEQTLP